MMPQQDRAEPSSAQQRHELTTLDEPAVCNPSLDSRKQCRGKGASGLLIMISAEAGKVISDGGEYDDDGDLGAVQAGPPMAKRWCSQGRQGPCVCVGGVRGKNKDLGLSLGWKIRAHLGCF
jgi:hypothetical protein